MGKGYRNAFKEIKHGITHNPITNLSKVNTSIVPATNNPIVNKLVDAGAGNPVKAVTNFVDARGTKRGKKIGTILETLGQGASTLGTLTEQPELAVLGTGLSAAGGYEKGESSGQIIGEAVGSYLGGKYLGGGSKVGTLIGQKVGSAVGGKVLGGLESQIDNRKGGRSHKDTINEGIHHKATAEDSSIHSHEEGQKAVGESGTGTQQYNQPVGQPVSEPVGEQVGEAVSPQAQQLEGDLQGLDEANEILSFLVENLPLLVKLSEGDRDAVLDEAINSGLLDNILSQAVNF